MINHKWHVAIMLLQMIQCKKAQKATSKKSSSPTQPNGMTVTPNFAAILTNSG